MLLIWLLSRLVGLNVRIEVINVDVIDWLLSNGDVLDGRSIAVIIFCCIVIEFIGIVGTSFGRMR